MNQRALATATPVLPPSKKFEAGPLRANNNIGTLEGGIESLANIQDGMTHTQLKMRVMELEKENS